MNKRFITLVYAVIFAVGAPLFAYDTPTDSPMGTPRVGTPRESTPLIKKVSQATPTATPPTFNFHNADDRVWWYALVTKSEFDRSPSTYAQPASGPSQIEPGDKIQMPVFTQVEQLLVLYNRDENDGKITFYPRYIFELKPSTRHFVQFGYNKTRKEYTLTPQKTELFMRNISRRDIKSRQDLIKKYGRF